MAFRVSARVAPGVWVSKRVGGHKGYQRRYPTAFEKWLMSSPKAEEKKRGQSTGAAGRT